MSKPPETVARPFTGRTVAWIIGGFFAVVFAFNIVFVRLALDSHSGIAEDAAYDKGFAYNDRLRATKAEAALGWSLSITAVRGEDGATRFTLQAGSGTDDTDTPLTGLDVTAKLVRTVIAGHDMVLDFVEVGQGVYVSDANVPMPGQWDLRILVARGDDAYRTTARLVL